jgi:YD repeat-containing protein
MSYATYYRDRGYVTEVGDALGRVTKYSWDDNYHLVHVTYPELNSVDYVYDARGNVTSVKTNPKPSVGGPVLLQTAMFDTVCSDIVICNQPRSVTDALGGTTNYGYQASASASLLRWGGGNFVYQTGTGKPISVFRPAPTLGAPRPQVQNTYVSGVLTRSSICKTLSVCAGTSDEVVTTFGYGGTEGGDRLLFEKTVAFSPSVVERTCYVPDQYGHRVSETPANSGLASCPTTVATAPPATSTLPSPGTTPSTPVFP